MAPIEAPVVTGPACLYASVALPAAGKPGQRIMKQAARAGNCASLKATQELGRNGKQKSDGNTCMA